MTKVIIICLFFVFISLTGFYFYAKGFAAGILYSDKSLKRLKYPVIIEKLKVYYTDGKYIYMKKERK